MPGLPGAQFGDDQGAVPTTSYLGDAGLNTWSPDLN